MNFIENKENIDNSNAYKASGKLKGGLNFINGFSIPKDIFTIDYITAIR